MYSLFKPYAKTTTKSPSLTSPETPEAFSIFLAEGFAFSGLLGVLAWFVAESGFRFLFYWGGISFKYNSDILYNCLIGILFIV